MNRESDSFQSILETMKKSAGGLHEAGVPFLLGGGLACWARGGPRTDHDVDFLLKPADVDAGLAALERLGMRTERPPEHWLVKAYDDGVLVDLIFEPSGLTVDEAMFERGEEMDVGAVRMRVAALEDVVATKVLALSEQDLDYRPVLEIARTLREQIDWDAVWRSTRTSPFAKAFFTLLAELQIVGRTGKEADGVESSFPVG